MTCQLSVKAYSHKGFSRFLFVSRVSIVSSKGKNQKTCSGKQFFLVLLLRFFSTLPGMVSEHFPAEVRIIFFIKKLSRAKNFLRKFFSWILDNFSLKKCFSITSRKNAKLNEHWETNFLSKISFPFHQPVCIFLRTYWLPTKFSYRRKVMQVVIFLVMWRLLLRLLLSLPIFLI